MPITHHISDEEISIDRQKGLLSGDADPAATQDGTLTKFRERDQSIKDDLEALATIFDGHDHDPANATGAGGQPLGTGDVRSFAAGAVTTAKLAAGAVTSAKVAAGAIDSDAIQDDAVTDAKIGDASTVSPGSLGAGADYTWNSPTQYPIFHVEGENSGYITYRASGGSIVFTNTHVSAVTFTIVYRGSD